MRAGGAIPARRQGSRGPGRRDVSPGGTDARDGQVTLSSGSTSVVSPFAGWAAGTVPAFVGRRSDGNGAHGTGNNAPKITGDVRRTLWR